MSKTFVVYYSWSNGNTKRIAEKMAEECKGAEIVHPMEIQFYSQGGPKLETSESKIGQWIAEIISSL